LRKESEAIFAGLENQLAFTTNESLAKALEDLEKNTTAHTAKTNETLQKLYQNFEKAAQDNANSLLASAGNEMASTLQERAAEVSREFATGLEGYTRSYLEAIGKSIAEIPQNMQGRSSQ
jgi:5'-deoxynucleotidase YfbR-like HD superfamily hydrolase